MHNIKLKVLNSAITEQYLPKYATPSSAGVDLRACISKDLVLKANSCVLIPTGIAIYLENSNLAATILPRSGLGHKHGIVLGNLVGLIDADYQGELKISAWNRSSEDFIIKPMERIAQLVIVPIVRAEFELVNDFEVTERAEAGFGSSGRN